MSNVYLFVTTIFFFLSTSSLFLEQGGSSVTSRQTLITRIGGTSRQDLLPRAVLVKVAVK